MRARIASVALGAALALAIGVPAAQAAFGVSEFKAQTRKSFTADDLERRAGSHPFVGVTDFTVNTTMVGTPDGNVKNIRVDIPPGLISNPEATRMNDGTPVKCTDAEFPACPPETKLGKVDLYFPAPVPMLTADVYNMVPQAGQVSDFAFDASQVTGQVRTDIVGGVRDTTDYGLFFTISDVPEVTNLVRSVLTFCGKPATVAEDNGCPDMALPFITLPTFCGPPGSTKLTLESWTGDTATAYDPQLNAPPIPALECNNVPFAPSITVTPDTTQHDTPTGVTVNLHVPQDQDPTHIASSHVKDAVVTLPPGVSINPAAATGLQACSDAQFALGKDQPVACPAASKVGTVEIATPNLPGPLKGSVYIGAPLPDNLFRLFVVADGYTLSVRLVGKVTPDPATGQLTTTFANTPQVPFTDFTLHFNGGPTATLANPLACGGATTTTALTPWSGNPNATPTSSYTVDADGAGTACPATPFALGFSAGTTNPLAGAFSPFTLTISRADGQQFLSKLSVQQPPGLLGMISNVTPCEEAAAAAGTCPDSSRIGTSTVASGAGSAPFSIQGPVYLTGPYNGAPFGLAIVVHAVAGPFDLGTVIVRSAIRVDPHDAHLVIDADPLPTILQGVPLRLRTITVAIDRDQFIFNPTSCDALAVGATLTSTEGTVQQVSSPFQAGGCADLPFAPKFTAASSAKTSKDIGASLSVTLRQSAGESNTRTVTVQLPKQFGARLETVSLACPIATFRVDPTKCADGSKIGTARAATPLLHDPLGGTVYLVAPGGALPTLEAVLEGSGITVDLTGTLDLSNGIKSIFKTVPDVPITEFKLDLPTGPHSALSATGDLCATSMVMPSTILSQSGKTVQQQTPVTVPDCPIKILSAKVKRKVATLKLRVPAAGKVTLAGKGLKTVKRSAKAASTITVKMKLTKKGQRKLRALRKRHKKMRVRVTARFAPAAGTGAIASKASARLAFK